MPHSYTPNPNNGVTTFTFPNNGDPATAESVNPDGFEDLADKVFRCFDYYSGGTMALGATATFTGTGANGFIFSCAVLFSGLGGLEPQFSTGFKVTSGTSLNPAQWVGSRLLGDAESEFNWQGLAKFDGATVAFEDCNTTFGPNGNVNFTCDEIIVACPATFSGTVDIGSNPVTISGPTTIHGSVQLDAATAPLTVSGAGTVNFNNTLTQIGGTLNIPAVTVLQSAGHIRKRIAFGSLTEGVIGDLNTDTTIGVGTGSAISADHIHCTNLTGTRTWTLATGSYGQELTISLLGAPQGHSIAVRKPDNTLIAAMAYVTPTNQWWYVHLIHNGTEWVVHDYRPNSTLL